MRFSAIFAVVKRADQPKNFGFFGSIKKEKDCNHTASLESKPELTPIHYRGLNVRRGIAPTRDCTHILKNV